MVIAVKEIDLRTTRKSSDQTANKISDLSTAKEQSDEVFLMTSEIFIYNKCSILSVNLKVTHDFFYNSIILFTE